MSKEELYGAIGAIIATVLIGALGSALEALGNAKKLPWLVSIGKKLEAIGQDGPKLAGKRAPDERILKAEVAAESATPDTETTR